MNNKIYNEDCFITINNIKENNVKVDLVLTSPPYNTSRKTNSARSVETHVARYDIHLDDMTDKEYIDWTVKLFEGYDSILSKNGVVLYNLSYGAENPNLMWLTVAEIINRTNFMVADNIVWKKGSALPNNTSHNKLTRIVEYVFVFCRKSEHKTFNANKSTTSHNSKGQKYYENIYNFVEARNNDGSCKLNKATYSTELCEKLLKVYAKPNSLVYDSFMGTGTTAVACNKLNLRYIGSELSNGQCEFADNRIANSIKNNFKIGDKVFIKDSESIYFKNWGIVFKINLEYIYVAICNDENCVIEFLEKELSK